MPQVIDALFSTLSFLGYYGLLPNMIGVHEVYC